MTFQLKNKPISISSDFEKMSLLGGTSATFSIYNNEFNANYYGNEFKGTHCSNLLLKIIAYIGAFFGNGVILTLHVKGRNFDDTRTFWVNRDIDTYIEDFGTHGCKNLTIVKSNSSWFSKYIAITVL